MGHSAQRGDFRVQTMAARSKIAQLVFTERGPDTTSRAISCNSGSYLMSASLRGPKQRSSTLVMFTSRRGSDCLCAKSITALHMYCPIAGSDSTAERVRGNRPLLADKD